MTTIKSYTDLQQSKKLAEILPVEAADMYWDYDVQKHEYYPMVMDDQFDDVCICAWSLAALLSVLPKETNISTPDTLNKVRYSCWNDYDITYADNPIDACVEMIIKLHKLNLLGFEDIRKKIQTSNKI